MKVKSDSPSKVPGQARELGFQSDSREAGQFLGDYEVSVFYGQTQCWENSQSQEVCHLSGRILRWRG